MQAAETSEHTGSCGEFIARSSRRFVQKWVLPYRDGTVATSSPFPRLAFRFQAFYHSINQRAVLRLFAPELLDSSPSLFRPCQHGHLRSAGSDHSVPADLAKYQRLVSSGGIRARRDDRRGTEASLFFLIAGVIAGIVNYHQSVLSLPFLLINPLVPAVYASAAHYLRKRLPADKRVHGIHDLVTLLGVSLLASLVSATAGTFVLVCSKLISPRDYWQATFNWWMGDAVALFSLTPLLLEFLVPRLRKFLHLLLEATDSAALCPTLQEKSHFLEHVGFVLALLFSFFLVFGNGFMHSAHLVDAARYLSGFDDALCPRTTGEPRIYAVFDADFLAHRPVAWRYARGAQRRGFPARRRRRARPSHPGVHCRRHLRRQPDRRLHFRKHCGIARAGLLQKSSSARPQSSQALPPYQGGW